MNKQTIIKLYTFSFKIYRNILKKMVPVLLGCNVKNETNFASDTLLLIV